jgi:hypothetical protein
MKPFISIPLHGILDYIEGICLLSIPWIFFTWESETAYYTIIGPAVLMLVSAIFTRYRYGIFRLVAFRYHLMLDYATGIFLLAAPWIFGFFHETYILHVLAGAVVIGAAFFTRREPKVSHTYIAQTEKPNTL